MTDRLLTPTKITAWLDCPHYLTLAHEAERGARDGRAATRQPGRAFGSMARLLMEKGQRHEEACLEHYSAEGRSVFEVPQRERLEPFTDWVERVGDPLADDHDVIVGGRAEERGHLPEDMSRGPDFLFSRNRLNVAVSRARCLAYLVCTEELLNSRARSVEEMRLLSTLAAFVERCDG